MTISAAPDVARSPAMRDAIAAFEQALASGGAVVIRGEAGTGGEMFARALHLASNDMRGQPVQKLLSRAMRATTPNGRPFIVFDCAAVNGAERQLFGTEGDDTGPDAVEQIDEGSALHRAIGGTLVLRNLPELPGRLQARLGRVLRDGEAFVVSAAKLRRVNVRPIAVIESLDDDRVNPELRRRLSQTTITMPPLRERREDLPVLIRQLLPEICDGFNIPRKRASSQAVALLAALPWRGNLQELDGLLRTLVLKTPDERIRQADVLANIRLDGGAASLTYGGSLKEARAQFERDYVASVLAQHHGRMTEAARTLGIQRTNLYRKVRQLAVNRRG